MVKLTEDMIVARTRVSDLAGVKKLNCWGADIDDVSVLKKCHNVEMLSLSLNSIDSLSDFQHCKKLQELFLRKNHINSLRELLWLKDLGKLKNLWLAENPCCGGGGNENQYRQTVIHNLPQLEKLDNVAISSQERAEALRYGEGVGEVDQDDGDSLADISRRMSIEELEDLRSEHGDNHHVHQHNHDEDYHRRFSSVSGPDDQDLVGSEYNSGSQYQHAQQQSSQYHQYQQQQYQHQQEERTSLMQQSSSLLRTGSSGRMSVSSYTPGSEMALMSPPEMLNNNQRQQRSSYFDDTRSSVSEYRPAHAQSGNFRSPGSHVYSISGSRGERPSHGPDLGRHSALQRPQRSRNSNILSSILCLIKEIDIPSLEVVEVAVRCRMEELDD